MGHGSAHSALRPRIDERPECSAPCRRSHQWLCTPVPRIAGLQPVERLHGRERVDPVPRLTEWRVTGKAYGVQTTATAIDLVQRDDRAIANALKIRYTPFVVD